MFWQLFLPQNEFLRCVDSRGYTLNRLFNHYYFRAVYETVLAREASGAGVNDELPLVGELHAALNNLRRPEDRRADVAKYREQVSAKSDLERTDLAKEKTGAFIGAYPLDELAPGEYTLTVASHDPDGVWHDWLEDAVAFTVSENDPKTNQSTVQLMSVPAFADLKEVPAAQRLP